MKNLESLHFQIGIYLASDEARYDAQRRPLIQTFNEEITDRFKGAGKSGLAKTLRSEFPGVLKLKSGERSPINSQYTLQTATAIAFTCYNELDRWSQENTGPSAEVRNEFERDLVKASVELGVYHQLIKKSGVVGIKQVKEILTVSEALFPNRLHSRLPSFIYDTAHKNVDFFTEESGDYLTRETRRRKENPSLHDIIGNLQEISDEHGLHIPFTDQVPYKPLRKTKGK